MEEEFVNCRMEITRVNKREFTDEEKNKMREFSKYFTESGMNNPISDELKAKDNEMYKLLTSNFKRYCITICIETQFGRNNFYFNIPAENPVMDTITCEFIDFNKNYSHEAIRDYDLCKMQDLFNFFHDLTRICDEYYDNRLNLEYRSFTAFFLNEIRNISKYKEIMDTIRLYFELYNAEMNSKIICSQYDIFNNDRVFQADMGKFISYMVDKHSNSDSAPISRMKTNSSEGKIII